MPLTTIAAPLAHPVTVEDCKNFARVDYDDEDELIDTLIGAAVEHVQQATGRQLAVATYRLSLRAFPHDCLISAAEPPTVEPVTSWPKVGEYPDAVQVEFQAGYPDTGSPAVSTVPNRARVAVKALVAHWYDNRTPIAETGWHTAPFHVTRLLTGLRVWGAL